MVGTGLKRVNTDFRKQLCHSNLKNLLYGHDRMISYWNEYYRHRYPRLKDYIGYKLFADHFGYTHSLERLRNK